MMAIFDSLLKSLLRMRQLNFPSAMTGRIISDRFVHVCSKILCHFAVVVDFLKGGFRTI